MTRRTHTRRRLATAALAAPALAWLPLGVRAQSFPSKPLRIVVPFGPGTSTDLTARFLAQRLGDLAKQSVVVENKPGANGILGVQHALSFPADGHTLVLGGNTSHAGNVSLFKALPYDPVKDFVAVSGVSIGGGAIVVSPTFAAKTIPELVALAKKAPNKYTYGTATAFSTVALAALAQETGIELLSVPYKGSASLSTEVMAGTVDMAFEPLVTLLPLIRGGKLHPLGVSTPRRAPGLEQIPTIAEQGVPGYKLLGWLTMFAKAGTPPDLVNQLNAWFTQILQMPEAAEFI
ncbi:MAG: Bug family tripartite tricarboxylate transporter substrate binding protein, partial [Burkholderiaceae bacterium]